MSGGSDVRSVHTGVRADPDQTRRVAIALIATGLDIHDRPGGLRDPALDIARDVAQALGLIPTVPACPAQRGSDSGSVGDRRRAYDAARTTKKETP